jgi:hypothetical protein
MERTGWTTFTCAECPWRETLPLIGLAAAEAADNHHPGHVIVREHNPSPRLRRRRRSYGKEVR